MKLAAFWLTLLVIIPLTTHQEATASTVQEKYTGLNFPVSLKFAPDGRIFFNEKDTGNIRVILANGTIVPTSFATISSLYTQGETGLLGIALDPNFATNHYVYVYFTTLDSQNYTHGHLRRYTDSNNQGTNPTEIYNVTSSIAGTVYHNGGYIKFGPDGKLYAEVGEFHNGAQAQNLSTTEGKILRMNPDGTRPSDNPFPNSLVYAYGIRNAFGMDWDKSNGRFIETEAGPNINDEINIIVAGGNYGWPDCTGACNPHTASMIDPIYQFDPVVTPTGIANVGPNTYYFGEWNTGNLVQLNLTSSGSVLSMTKVYTASGGIVAVELGPDGNLYFTSTDTIYMLPLPNLVTSAGLTGLQFYGLVLGTSLALTVGAIIYWKKGHQRKASSLQDHRLQAVK